MRILVLVAFAVINASTAPSVVAECTANKDVDVARARWATLRTQAIKAADKERSCRAYAASFYETVVLRQAAEKCGDGEQTLAVLDSEINDLNGLLATKCSG